MLIAGESLDATWFNGPIDDVIGKLEKMRDDYRAKYGNPNIFIGVTDGSADHRVGYNITVWVKETADGTTE